MCIRKHPNTEPDYFACAARAPDDHHDRSCDQRTDLQSISDQVPDASGWSIQREGQPNMNNETSFVGASSNYSITFIIEDCLHVSLH